MKRSFHLLSLALSVIGFSAMLNAENLMPGDTGCETTDRDVAYGTWSGVHEKFGRKEYHFWELDQGRAWQGKRSLWIRNNNLCAADEILLPKGHYTFSFYACAEKEGEPASIGMHPFRRSTFASLHQKRKRFKLGTEWKRYSFSFESDGKESLVPLFQGKGWFDAFQINRGTEPTPWNCAQAVSVGMETSYAEANTYLVNEPVSATIRVSDNAGIHPDTLTVRVRDWQEKTVLEKQFPAKDLSLVLPSSQPGWFELALRVSKGKKVLASRELSYVVVRPPAELAAGMRPFSGMSAQPVLPEAYRRIGVRWLESHIFWEHAERRKSSYDYDYLHHFSQFRKLREMGFRNKACFTLACPQWRQEPGIVKAARERGISLHRFLPPESQMEAWRAFIRDFLGKYRQECDSFEIGWELDAQLGRNAFYKALYPDSVAEMCVFGPIPGRAARQIEIAAEEIRKVRKNAVIAACRPSDLDTRQNFRFSESIFKITGKSLNAFGIDCYPRPRWIGPGNPPSGSEQDLRSALEKARKVMKEHCADSRIYISEYGYFIDYKNRKDASLQIEQANRLARSFLFARALGFESLHYYTGQYWSNLLENGRYTMSIWERGLPMRAVAAYSAAAHAVENVTKAEIVELSRYFSGVVFEKADRSAVAALWSLRENYSPEIRIKGDGIVLRDLCGAVFSVEKRNGEFGFRLTECPVYLELTGPDAGRRLGGIIRNLKIKEDYPVDFLLRPVEAGKMKLYLTNRSLKQSQSGFVRCGAELIRYHIPAGGECVVHFQADTGKDQKVSVTFDGGYRIAELVYKSELIRVPRWTGSWKQVPEVKVDTMANILPVDVFGWNGKQDLSMRIQIAHDGSVLKLRTVVTDDHHYNRFSADRIWRGDSLQIGIDPLMNASGRHDGLDADDFKMTAALAQGRSVIAVHNARSSGMEKRILCHVQRSESSGSTLYELELPLEKIHPVLKSGRVFGFNLAVLDDDSGGGMDYWMFLRTGLVEEQRPDKYASMILE